MRGESWGEEVDSGWRTVRGKPKREQRLGGQELGGDYSQMSANTVIAG